MHDANHFNLKMDRFSTDPSNQICDKSGNLPKQKIVSGSGNASGPLINLLQKKKPPVSMQLKSNNGQSGASIPVVSSNIGFNSG
jgi:hypothetical protein